MRIRTFLISSFVLFLLTYMYAQMNIYPVSGSAKKPEKNGMFFALPRTLVKVSITVKETEYLRGPYADYAQQLMGINNPITQPLREFEIADMHFETQAEPDPGQWYFMEMDEKASKEDRNVQVYLTTSGILRGINALSPVRDERSIQENQTVLTTPSLFDQAVTASLTRRIDTVIRVITIDTSTIRKRYFNISFEEKPTEEKAREAADMVSRLRESRFNLLTGYQETSFSRETIEYMDRNLQRMMDDYISLFRGLKTEKLSVYVYYLVPDPDKPNQVVCRFSKEAGILDAADNKGREVMLTARRSGTLDKVPTWAARPAESKVATLPCRLPEMVNLSLKYSGKTYDDRYQALGQFGVVTQIPVLKNRIELDPESGGIQSVLFE